MKTTAKKITRKQGPNRNEPAHKAQPLDANFKQSRDIHEDRGARQIKTSALRRAPKAR